MHRGLGHDLLVDVQVAGITVHVSPHREGHEAGESRGRTGSGGDPDLEKATEIAVRETVEFLQERTGLSSGEAYPVVSMAVDLRVTELVDGNVGVHAMVPKALLASTH
jgi:acetamidase/formamidase